MNILFVCTGNTCRSPMAEALLKHKNKSVNGLNLKVKSAGLSVVYGSLVSAYSKQVLKNHKLQTRKVPTQLSGKLIDWADLVLTMTNDQAGAIKNATGKDYVFSFGEYVGYQDVLDPYGLDINYYNKTFYQLSDYCDKLIEKLLFLKKVKNG